MGLPSWTARMDLNRWGVVSAGMHALILVIGMLFVLARTIPEPEEQGIAVELVSPGPPQLAQADVERAEVASFVRGLRGSDRTRRERFDDHGSAENWPRGSF